MQEHEASHHHFDIRLERGGVYISFAVPKGIPEKPGEKNFAIRTGNHPLKYAGFEDAIPEGETGTGEVPIGDKDLYFMLEWTDDKIEVMMKG